MCSEKCRREGGYWCPGLSVPVTHGLVSMPPGTSVIPPQQATGRCVEKCDGIWECKNNSMLLSVLGITENHSYERRIEFD